MSEPILQLRSLTKRFGSVAALQDVDLDLRAGEVHALCGENGAGKSTLIKVLSGLWPHGSYEGELRLEGREARFASTADAEAAGIAVIYQELALVPDMTVAENLFLGSEPRSRGLIDWPRLHARAAELLARFGLGARPRIEWGTTESLDGLLDPHARVSDLGVGQKQLVEILKALAKEARILLLDEPTAALTESEAALLLDIVRDLSRHGVTCIYISHRLDEVFAIADRITVLRDGYSVTSLETADTDKAAVIRAMVGRELGDLFPRRSTEPGEVLLAVEGLTVEAGGRRVLEDISLQVRAGEVLGIGGLMGAGRTELLMHLFGAFGRRAGGCVTLLGKELVDEPPGERLARGLALVSEDRKRYGLVLEQSVGFNLSLASLDALSHRGLLDHAAEAQANQELFEALAVKATGQESIVGQLSGGNQQKVVLGKVLMTDPSVVLLDEPTRGIDVGAKVEVFELINRLTAAGKAVVLVSSELPELLGMADRILVLCEGRLGGAFDRSEATQEALMAAAMAHHDRSRRSGA